MEKKIPMISFNFSIFRCFSRDPSVNKKRNNQHFYQYERNVADKKDEPVMRVLEDQVMGGKHRTGPRDDPIAAITFHYVFFQLVSFCSPWTIMYSISEPYGGPVF